MFSSEPLFVGTLSTAGPATAYSLSGPNSGTVGTATSNFTVASNGLLLTSVVVTPSDNGNLGTFSPSAVILNAGFQTSATFSYTPAQAGTYNISCTNSAALANPPPISFTAVAAGRNWAFLLNEGGSPANWTSANSGWANMPFDGLHNQTDYVDSFWFGSADSWSPTPRSMMMTNQWSTPGASGNWIDMGQAARGTYNSTWLSWLQAAASETPAPIAIVRIWPEINGNWFPWSINQTGSTSVDGTPNGSAWPVATIQAAFQNMATQVRSALPHAVIEFNLAAGGPWTGPTSPGNGTGFDLYPGNSYVDVVGIDAYEKSLTFAEVQSGSGVNLNGLVSFASTNSKLVAWSEIATENCDGSYITDICNFFDSLGSQGAYWSYYDEGTANNGGNIIYATTGTDSCPANTLRAALNASSFGTKPFVGTWTTQIPHG